MINDNINEHEEQQVDDDHNHVTERNSRGSCKSFNENHY